MELSALTIKLCEVGNNGPVNVRSGLGNEISLKINPDKISLKRPVCLSDDATMGDKGAGRRFSRMPPGTLVFDVVLDGTGIVPSPENSDIPKEVDLQVEALSRIVYRYDNDIRQPNVVCVCWGTLRFICRLTEFNIQYTLFKPSGAPLRAKTTLSFEEYLSQEQAQQEKGGTSQDQGRSMIVQEGDTLPQLCMQAYGDYQYYTAVARYNKLSLFRALVVGMVLVFPRLENIDG
ncbi:CIS tube protein [Chromobacterium subtsugae]|uniref:CIS tube protein n=1 Tax=Chromobacterium subtsugae TaxID=251747 RepID=UPI00069C4B79|nr:hypothetical protein [Chromobacterium subtsugae]